jgi:hypothetical protein
MAGVSHEYSGDTSSGGTMVKVADADDKWLCRSGGISAGALGVAYIVIITLYVPMGTPPSGSEARLAFVAANMKTWWVILALSVLTDLLFAPVALALYVALKAVNRNAMVLASMCVALFIILDLALTWTNYAVLITLSGKYARAVSEPQKMGIITAAEYPCGVLESGLLFVYNTLTLSVGILITGAVMLKGAFSRTAAYLGLITGILGLVAVVGPYFVNALSMVIIITSILTTAWILVVAFRLYGHVR